MRPRTVSAASCRWAPQSSSCCRSRRWCAPHPREYEARFVTNAAPAPSSRGASCVVRRNAFDEPGGQRTELDRGAPCLVQSTRHDGRSGNVRLRLPPLPHAMSANADNGCLRYPPVTHEPLPSRHNVGNSVLRCHGIADTCFAWNPRQGRDHSSAHWTRFPSPRISDRGSFPHRCISGIEPRSSPRTGNAARPSRPFERRGMSRACQRG